MEHQQKQPHHRNDIAFVLGNGKSRLNADLNILKDHGVIYGCNALYREFEPDYLVAVDVKMINEIIDSGYHKRREVWTNPNKGVKTKARVNFLVRIKDGVAVQLHYILLLLKDTRSFTFWVLIMRAATASLIMSMPILLTIKKATTAPHITVIG